MKILVLNGPNLNMLGIRNQNHYGKMTLSQINKNLAKLAKREEILLEFFQSNHEGELIDIIQKNRNIAGILINPGALTHYGYSLRDALSDSGVPIVEVHLSNIKEREDFRKIDVLDGIVIKQVMGFKEKSYELGLEFLISFLKKEK